MWWDGCGCACGSNSHIKQTSTETILFLLQKAHAMGLIVISEDDTGKTLLVHKISPNVEYTRAGGTLGCIVGQGFWRLVAHSHGTLDVCRANNHHMGGYRNPDGRSHQLPRSSWLRYDMVNCCLSCQSGQGQSIQLRP